MAKKLITHTIKQKENMAQKLVIHTIKIRENMNQKTGICTIKRKHGQETGNQYNETKNKQTKKLAWTLIIHNKK